MANEYSVRDTRVGFVEQTAWGTAEADSVAVVELDVEPIDIDRNLQFIEGYGSHGRRIKSLNDVEVNENQCTPSFSLSGIVLDDIASHLLYNYIQNVVEDATTPFKKTFTFPATQPDFTTNAGHFWTLINRSPSASTSEKVKDIVCRQLDFSIEPAQPLMFSGQFVGRGAVVTNSNPSGTWTRLEKKTAGVAEYFHYARQTRHTINFGAGAQSVTLIGGFKMSFQQDVEFFGQDANGNFQNLIISNRRGTFSGRIAWDAHAASLISNLKVGTAATINVGWGGATAGTTHRDLDFVIRGKFRSGSKVNENIFGIQFDFEMLQDVGGSVEALTVITADAVDRTW